MPNTPTVEISYGVLEKALAVACDIPEATRSGSFRSALANLQKLGALGEAARVGRGSPLRYGPDEMHRLVFAVELVELGIPPATAVALIEAFWVSKIRAIFTAAERTARRGEPGDDDVVVYLSGVSLRTGAWSSSKGGAFPGVPNINRCNLGDLPKHMHQVMLDDTESLPPRAIVVNLSNRLRTIHRAIAMAHTAELSAEYRKDAPRVDLMEALHRSMNRDSTKSRAQADTERDGKKRRARR
jgi:hypothetical protein